MKKRAWAGVLYEDSCNKEWRKIIEDTHLQYCYAKHDKDKNPDGTEKETHIHIMWCYDGPQTEKQAKEIGKLLGVKNDVVLAVHSIKGMYRYFTHKDNPEKYQYEEAILNTGNGFDADNIIELTPKEIKEIKKDIINIIKDNEIKEYANLIDLLLEHDEDYVQIASTNTIFFNTYITSKRYGKKEIL